MHSLFKRFVLPVGMNLSVYLPPQVSLMDCYVVFTRWYPPADGSVDNTIV